MAGTGLALRLVAAPDGAQGDAKAGALPGDGDGVDKLPNGRGD